jgi:hypothetical protein
VACKRRKHEDQGVPFNGASCWFTCTSQGGTVQEFALVLYSGKDRSNTNITPPTSCGCLGQEWDCDQQEAPQGMTPEFLPRHMTAGHAACA